MNGIVININPVALQIGHFELRWYSLTIMLAVIVAVLVAAREAKRKGLSSAEIYNLLPWVLISGFVGARLFHVIDRWEYYTSNPLQIVMVQQGGLAIWGALAGGLAAAVVYARIRHLPLGLLADIAVPALLVAQIIGRFGCIINGDVAGNATGLPWGFVYINPHSMVPQNLYGVPTQPYPVYEILWNMTALLIILRLRHRITKDGFLFLTYLALYSVGRFALTFVRSEKIWFWGLQEAQVVSIVVFIVSISMFIYLVRKPKRDVSPTIAA